MRGIGIFILEKINNVVIFTCKVITMGAICGFRTTS